jgi:membrane dipeptidase
MDTATPAAPIRSRLQHVFADTLVWENHACVSFEEPLRFLPELARFRDAGFNLVHLNIGDSTYSFEHVTRMAALFRDWIAERADQYALALTLADARRAKREGKLAICFDVEGVVSIENDLSRVALYHELGVRWMALVYNRANLAGSGVHDDVDHGLTPFGRELVAEMDRVGLIKDLAHTGYRTALDVCGMTRVPVTISHSNPRALTDHPRCVPDELMRACAATGGVLGISGIGIFLGNNDVSAQNIVRSIDYAVEVMGIDHVGIGTDYGMSPEDVMPNFEKRRHVWPAGYGYESGIRFAPPECIGDVAELLLTRGYSDAAVGKILGGNFARVAGQIWK